MTDEQIDLAVNPRSPGELAAEAFVRALGELENPARTNTATVQTKAGGTYSYTYADLAAVLAAVRPVLARHELAISQPIALDNGELRVRTRILHVSGGVIENEAMRIRVEGGAQDIGSMVTYARRYALLSMLGLAPEGEDDDGASASTPAREAGLPDPLYQDMHLSERTIEALDDLAAAPPSARIGALATAWAERRREEAKG